MKKQCLLKACPIRQTLCHLLSGASCKPNEGRHVFPTCYVPSFSVKARFHVAFMLAYWYISVIMNAYFEFEILKMNVLRSVLYQKLMKSNLILYTINSIFVSIFLKLPTYSRGESSCASHDVV